MRISILSRVSDESSGDGTHTWRAEVVEMWLRSFDQLHSGRTSHHVCVQGVPRDHQPAVVGLKAPDTHRQRYQNQHRDAPSHDTGFGPQHNTCQYNVLHDMVLVPDVSTNPGAVSEGVSASDRFNQSSQVCGEDPDSARPHEES